MFDVDLRNLLDGMKGAKRTLYNNWNEITGLTKENAEIVHKFLIDGDWEAREIRPDYTTKRANRFMIQYR